MDEHRPPRELLDTSVRYSPDAAACEILTAPIRNVLAEVDRRIAGNEPAGAEHLLLQLRRAAPGSVHVNMLLAGLYCEHRQYSNALPLLNAVLAVDTQFSPAMVRKADALYRLDRVGEAVAIARTLATLDPNNAEYLNNLGTYQQAAGNFEEAGTAFSQAIAIRPDFVAAWHNLLQLPDRTLDGAQLEHVKALCTDPALSDRQRAMASLCVGRHYRMRGDVSREFAWLERGKSALAELSPWDRSGFAKLVAEITAVTPAALACWRQARTTRVTPIFVSSMPRAGATLLEQIISTHPDVTSIGEAGLATRAARATVAAHGLDDPHWWRWLRSPDAPDLLATACLGFDRAIAGFVPNTDRVCEKSVNNDLMLGLCLSAFPDAYVVHCRRDPLDICLSAYQAYFPDGDYNNRLEWLAARYEQHVRLMAHWQATFPGRIVEARYEDFVTRPEAEAERILTAIGLPPPPGGLQIESRKYAVRSASNWQVRQPIYRSSRHRWHRYRRQLAGIMHLRDG